MGPKLLSAFVAVVAPLGTTVAIEVAVAALFGLRRRALGTVVWINFVTNPLLSLLWLSLFALGLGQTTVQADHLVPADWMWLLLGLLEAIVVMAEWRLLVWVLGRKAVDPRRLLVATVVMNLVSATLGTFLLSCIV